MKIDLIEATEHPLAHIGKMAGICWGANTEDSAKNAERAKECIRSGHGRVLEFVSVTVAISGASARVMREIYTHLGGAPTRLQSSTRYVSETRGFEYYIPPEIDDNIGNKSVYTDAMSSVQGAYNHLVENGVAVENAANLLPLGMMSRMVWKINLRALINFMNMRLCSRAYIEMQCFARLLKKTLMAVDDEWKWISDSMFVPKCEQFKYLNPGLAFCTEKFCCGRHKKVDTVEIV